MYRFDIVLSIVKTLSCKNKLINFLLFYFTKAPFIDLQTNYYFNSISLYPSKLLTHLVNLKHFKQVYIVVLYSLKIFQALLKPTLCFDLLSLRGTYVFSLVALCKACVLAMCKECKVT